MKLIFSLYFISAKYRPYKPTVLIQPSPTVFGVKDIRYYRSGIILLISLIYNELETLPHKKELN
jgi:hypothetical protein